MSTTRSGTFGKKEGSMRTERPHARVSDPLADLPLLIPVPKAAKLLGISRTAAYRHASAGDLPVKRLGRRLYVVTARLSEFVDPEGRAA
jgi:Helix-turn-helix domain